MNPGVGHAAPPQLPTKILREPFGPTHEDVGVSQVSKIASLQVAVFYRAHERDGDGREFLAECRELLPLHRVAAVVHAVIEVNIRRRRAVVGQVTRPA